jgi:universal stress protein E
MHSIRRILVAIGDPKVRRSPVLARAAQLAAGCGARIELFHGIATQIPVDLLGGDKDTLDSLQREVRAATIHDLERLAAPWRRRGLRITTAAEWDFPVHESVIRQALASHADLIVAHQHGKHRFPHLLHHTDWDLLRESPVPVLLVRSKRRYRGKAVLAAIDPAHTFAKPARLDALILRQAQAAAGALTAPLHVAHAFLPVPAARHPVHSRYQSPADIERQAQTRAQNAFARAVASSQLPARRCHLEEGHPALVLPTLARRLHADMVVMGAVSRSGWQRLLIGNTAEQVIDELKCDLLIVKPAHFDSRIQKRRRGAWLVPLLT